MKSADGLAGSEASPAAILIASEHAITEAPPPDDLFAGAEKFAKNAKDISEVNLDKNLLGMVDSLSDNSPANSNADTGNLFNASSFTRKLDLVSVRSYEYSGSDEYSTSDLNAFRARFNTADWTHVVKERSGKDQKDQTDVWMRIDPGSQLSEIVVIDAEAKELDFVHIKGHMTLQELAAAGARYGVPSNALMPNMHTPQSHRVSGPDAKNPDAKPQGK